MPMIVMKSELKLKAQRERVGKHGEIQIPQDYADNLGLAPGKEISLRPMGKGLYVEAVREAVVEHKPRKSPVDELNGILEIDDPAFVDELLESEDVYSS